MEYILLSASRKNQNLIYLIAFTVEYPPTSKFNKNQLNDSGINMRTDEWADVIYLVCIHWIKEMNNCHCSRVA
jgi:hypothetical protein